MAKKQWTWAPGPTSRPKAKISDLAKAEIQKKCEELIELTLKPQHIKPPPQNSEWNYLVDIFAKWQRSYLYFCSKYNCPSPNAIAPSFEDKFARLEYVGPNQFNLSYRRHTQQWLEIAAGLTLEQCLETIKDDPLFTP